MAGKDLNQQLNELIQSCKSQGILGDSFDQLRRLQDEDNPTFMADLLTSFNADKDKDMAELAAILNEPEVNHPQVKYFADKLYSINASFGGSRVRNASLALCGAADAKDTAKCRERFEVLNGEYLTLRENLTSIAQLERQIYENNKATSDSSDEDEGSDEEDKQSNSSDEDEHNP